MGHSKIEIGPNAVLSLRVEERTIEEISAKFQVSMATLSAFHTSAITRGT